MMRVLSIAMATNSALVLIAQTSDVNLRTLQANKDVEVMLVLIISVIWATVA